MTISVVLIMLVSISLGFWMGWNLKRTYTANEIRLYEKEIALLQVLQKENTHALAGGE
jgi:hypothetical protein